jgi:predicted secreted Zn-dependent protease
VAVHGVMALPNWIDEAKAEPGLRARWDRFVAALKLHEEGHFDHGRQFGSELERSLAMLGAQNSCNTLDVLTHQHYDALLEKYRAIDMEYDATTDHGRTQGAIF